MEPLEPLQFKHWAWMLLARVNLVNWTGSLFSRIVVIIMWMYFSFPKKIKMAPGSTWSLAIFSLQLLA